MCTVCNLNSRKNIENAINHVVVIQFWLIMHISGWEFLHILHVYISALSVLQELYQISSKDPFEFSSLGIHAAFMCFLTAPSELTLVRKSGKRSFTSQGGCGPWHEAPYNIPDDGCNSYKYVNIYIILCI